MLRAAVDRLEQIYERNTAFLANRFEAYAKGESFEARVRACYPFVRITTRPTRVLTRACPTDLSPAPAFTRRRSPAPISFAPTSQQIGLLIKNHAVPIEIGEFDEPIPIHFAYRRDINSEASATPRETAVSARPLRDLFDVPDLGGMDDAIADGTHGRPVRRCHCHSLCSVPPASTIPCTGSITTPGPIPSISRTS